VYRERREERREKREEQNSTNVAEKRTNSVCVKYGELFPISL